MFNCPRFQEGFKICYCEKVFWKSVDDIEVHDTSNRKCFIASCTNFQRNKQKNVYFYKMNFGKNRGLV